MGEWGRRAMFEIMERLPGGTLINNDKVISNVNTVYQQEKLIKPKRDAVAEWNQLNSKQQLNSNMAETVKEEKKGIVLPTEIKKAESINCKNMCLYGLPKSGKTTALSELPNNLLLDTENGSEFVEGLIMKAPEGMGPVSKFKWLKDVAAEIKAQGRPYDFVSIDTFSQLDMDAEWVGTYNYMQTVQGKKFNRDANGNMLKPDHPDYESVLTLPNGYGYRYTREAILDMYESLRNLGKICTIFVCHVADKMMSKKNGEEVMTKDLALIGKTRDIIPRLVDATANVWNENGEFMISFIGDSQKVGGVRAKHLTGYSGKLEWSKIFIKE